MAAYTILLEASHNDTLTPVFDFPSGTVNYSINDGVPVSMTTGVAASIVVFEGDKVEYICSDWDAITGINMYYDDVTGDIGVWVLPTDLEDLDLSGIDVSGDIGSWVLPAGLVTCLIGSSTSTTLGDIGGWVLPASLESFKISSLECTGDIASWDLSVCTGLTDFYINANYGITGDLTSWEFPASLRRFYLHDSAVSGSVEAWDFSACTSMTTIAVGNTNLTGDIAMMPGFPNSLVSFWLNQTALNYDSIGGPFVSIVSESIDINIANCVFTYAQVDNILADLVTSGVANGELSIEGSNSGPSAAGTASKATLELAGWTIVINAEIVYPTQASSPTPVDSGTGIAVSTNLSWTKDFGDEVYVYFDKQTDHDPPTTKVVDNVDQASYNPPGDLDPDTTYVWRVDTSDGVLITTGDQWEFTTLAVPTKATTPTPADLGTGIAINTNLSWVKEVSATVLVYLDKKGDHDPPTTKVVNDLDVSSYDPAVDLTNDTTYVWRVDTKNGSGTTTGDQWEFTTVVAAGGDELSYNRGGARGIGLGINRGVV